MRPPSGRSLLYSNYTHIVTTTGSGIASVADLRGKTVSTGSPGSGTEVIAMRLLRAAGLDPDRDGTRQGLGASESAGALKDGKVAAFFFSGGLPTVAVQDLAHSPGTTMRLLSSANLIPSLRRDYGDLYFPLETSAGAYRGVDRAVSVVGVANVLVVNRSMPDDLAHDRHRGTGGGLRGVDSRPGLRHRAGSGRPRRGAPVLRRWLVRPGRPGAPAGGAVLALWQASPASWGMIDASKRVWYQWLSENWQAWTVVEPATLRQPQTGKVPIIVNR